MIKPGLFLATETAVNFTALARRSNEGKALEGVPVTLPIQRPYLTYQELSARWQCSLTDVAYLIREGALTAYLYRLVLRYENHDYENDDTKAYVTFGLVNDPAKERALLEFVESQREYTKDDDGEVIPFAPELPFAVERRGLTELPCEESQTWPEEHFKKTLFKIEEVESIEAQGLTANNDSRDSKPALVEHNARKREQVLAAALSLLAAFPDQCKGRGNCVSAQKLAELVADKAPLFWESREPPLTIDTMTRMFRGWLKKAKPDE